MGSFIMMNQMANPNKNVNGSMSQTLDVLDFSMIHLSWYERLMRRHIRTILYALKIDRKDKKRNDELYKLDTIANTVEILKERALNRWKEQLPLPVPELNRTVAIMPFLASDMGAGHSKITNRFGNESNHNKFQKYSTLFSLSLSNSSDYHLIFLITCEFIILE